MKYNELLAPRNKTNKRVGRGIASGRGKTAGRGTKGQGSRTGYSKNPGFEGGQNPLMQLLPKLPGFKSKRPKALLVYTDQLDQFAGKTIDAELLAKHGLITSAYETIKLLSRGELTQAVTVKLQAASQSAITALQQAGGTFEAVPRLQRPKIKKTKSESN